MKLASPKVFSILQVKRPADVSAEGHGAQLALEFTIQNVPLYLLSHIFIQICLCQVYLRWYDPKGSDDWQKQITRQCHVQQRALLASPRMA